MSFRLLSVKKWKVVLFYLFIYLLSLLTEAVFYLDFSTRHTYIYFYLFMLYRGGKVQFIYRLQPTYFLLFISEREK